MPPVFSQNSWPWRRPLSIRPNVATTEATPRMMPTICRMLRLLCAAMSTTPSITESQSEKKRLRKRIRRAMENRLAVHGVGLDAAVHDLHGPPAALRDPRVVGHDHDRLAPGVHLVEDLQDLE